MCGKQFTAAELRWRTFSIGFLHKISRLLINLVAKGDESSFQ
jgi:hypothetical protein